MAKRRYGVRTNLFGIFAGLVCGLLFASWFKRSLLPCGPHGTDCCDPSVVSQNAYESKDSQVNEGIDISTSTADVKKKDNFLFIGVMTAQKYIDTRALTAFRTWSDSVNGKVMFFSSAGSKTEHNELPVIGLSGVDDSYPPQKKSFMMLKYFHDHYIDDYEWFMRADDDVFIKGDQLEKFLRSVNSSKPQFIGQAGLGTKQEFGQLSLNGYDNFCMGGPGIVFSRETLRLIAKKIGYCLQNLYTTHEDVEVGRCVQQFAGIPCTWAFEMQHLFYHNYREEKGSFTHSLNAKEVHRAITLHPVKEPVHQYRIRNYFSSRHILDLRQKSLNLHREIAQMNQEIGLKNSDVSSKQLEMFPSLTKYVPDERDNVLSWEYFTKPVFSDGNANPKRGMESQVRSALDDVIMQIMQMVNKNARQRGRTIDFKEILYGYKRTNPQHGADYVLDLLLIYRKHKGRRMTVPVRRHAYLHQTFSQMEFIEELLNVHTRHNPLPANVVHIFKDFYTKSSDAVPDSLSVIDKTKEKIHFIMPLSGRYEIFQRFMINYENVVLKTSESAVLHVIMFDSTEDMALEKSINLVSTYQQNYGGDTVDVTQANGPFSRGQGLEMGAAQCKTNDLLFFIDVDIMITRDCLYRIRTNTKQGLQAYFPIVFSQYDPQTICPKGSARCKKNVHGFQTDTGYWRQFGFGIAGLYQSDLRLVGGFDTTIQGWGKEDVDLYHKFLMGNITIFRAVDSGMVHTFHPIVCEAGLEPTQYQMCLGSKASSYGSTKRLANLVFDLERELQKQTNEGGKKTKS